MRPPIDLPPMKNLASPTPLPRRGDDLLERLLEHRRPIGDLAALTHVRKVEGHDVDTASREPLRHRRHERMLLSGAGPVREHEQRYLAFAVCSIAQHRTDRTDVEIHHTDQTTPCRPGAAGPDRPWFVRGG